MPIGRIQASVKAGRRAGRFVGSGEPYPGHHRYVDSVKGRDHYHGRSSGQPWRTLDRLLGSARVHVGFARGSVWNGRTLMVPRAGSTCKAYGRGATPWVDASVPIPRNAWLPHASHPGVYYAVVRHRVTTVPSGANASDTFHCGLWFNDTFIAGYWAGGSITANESHVAAAPGRWTAYKEGSANADPRVTGEGTNTIRYVVRPPGDGNLRSGAVRVSYAEQMTLLWSARDVVIDGLGFRRAAEKNMTNVLSAQVMRRFANVTLSDAAVHGGVLLAREFLNIVGTGRADQITRAVGGVGLNLFFAESVGVYSPSMLVRGCRMSAFGTAYGSHGVGSGNPIHDSVEIRDCSAIDCNIAVSISDTLNGLTVNGLTASRCATGISTPLLGAVVARRMIYTSSLTGNVVGLSLNTDATVEDSSFLAQSTGTNYLYINNYAQAQNSDDVFTLTLNRVVNTKGFAPITNPRWLQVLLAGAPLAPILDDFSTPTACFALRRLRTAYSGNLIRIRRSSDNGEADIGFASDGFLDEAAVASHIGSDDAFIVTWYDQSGNGRDVTQATTTKQMQLATAGTISKIRGKSSAFAPANGCGYVSATFTGYTGNTLTALVVARPAGAGANSRIVSVVKDAGFDYASDSHAVAVQGNANGTANLLGYYRNGTIASAGTRTTHLASCGVRFDGANGITRVNAVTVSNAKTASFDINRVLIGNQSSTTSDMGANTYLSEAVVWFSDITDAELVRAISNQVAYWGTG